MKEFTTILLGDMPLPVFLAYLTIALIAAIIAMGLRGNAKRKTSTGTPNSFSIRFLLRDNLMKILFNILLIAFAIRFCNEIMGQEATGWMSAIIGLSVNALAQKFKKFEDKARD